MKETISVVLADDHPLFRDGVAKTLANEPDIEVMAQAGDAASAIELTQEYLPDIVLLDVSMPGGGLTAAEQIAKSCPVVRIIMLTVAEDEEIVHKALEIGASGYVLKGVSAPELVSIVRNVSAGEAYITPSLAATLLQSNRQSRQSHDPVNALTPRESQILAELANGASNKDIAATLHMGERTVKHHMTNILQKLHLKNRVEAALFAQKTLVDGDQG